MTNKQIYLEPFVNELGFLQLRDSDSKRPVAFVDHLKLDNSSDGIQMATCQINVDPRVRDANKDD